MPIADLLRKVIATGGERDATTIRAKRLRYAKTQGGGRQLLRGIDYPKTVEHRPAQRASSTVARAFTRIRP